MSYPFLQTKEKQDPKEKKPKKKCNEGKKLKRRIKANARLIQPHPVELVVSHKSIFSRKLLETEFLASNFPPPRKAVVPSSDETKLTAFL